MNKKVRKILSKLVPTGGIKELVKLYYYNLNSPKNVRFKRNKERKTYITSYNNHSIETATPLYFIYKDFQFYTNFYVPKNDDVVLDIGANSGFISLYLASILNNDGMVYSIEPDNSNIRSIENNLALNPDYKSKIKIDSSLIWNSNTQIEFHEDSSVASSVFYKGEKAKTVLKDAITLDSWVEKNNVTKVDFIKMDIEGAEVEAIEGATKVIKNFKPNFAIASYHYINGEPTYIKLEKLFNDLNYPCKTVKLTQSEIITYAGPIAETLCK